METEGANEYRVDRTDTTKSANLSATRNNVVVKVGMVGDAQVGKTSLMVKYVEGKFDEDYIHTLGRSTPVVSAFGFTHILCRC